MHSRTKFWDHCTRTNLELEIMRFTQLKLIAMHCVWHIAIQPHAAIRLRRIEIM